MDHEESTKLTEEMRELRESLAQNEQEMEALLIFGLVWPIVFIYMRTSFKN